MAFYIHSLMAIITERLNAVRRLLTTTHETIEAIGASCGYDNPNYLKNLFRRRFGMTMRDFRRSTHGGPATRSS